MLTLGRQGWLWEVLPGLPHKPSFLGPSGGLPETRLLWWLQLDRGSLELERQTRWRVKRIRAPAQGTTACFKQGDTIAPQRWDVLHQSCRGACFYPSKHRIHTSCYTMAFRGRGVAERFGMQEVNASACLAHHKQGTNPPLLTPPCSLVRVREAQRVTINTAGGSSKTAEAL